MAGRIKHDQKKVDEFKDRFTSDMVSQEEEATRSIKEFFIGDAEIPKTLKKQPEFSNIMANYIFSNIIGSFVFDSSFKLVDKITDADKEEAEKKLIEKHKAIAPQASEITKILEFFKKEEFFNEFYKKNLLLTKKQTKQSVSEDLLIIQTIGCIEDIDKVVNTLVKRLREWYSLYNPETSYSISDNNKFAQLVIKKNKKELLNELNLEETDSMGAELSEENLKEIISLAEQAANLYLLRQQYEQYLETLMRNYCPNLVSVAGALIGAKLIEIAGGLKRLMEFPASTVQLLGAEKALFRHMVSGAKAPKHGVLHGHPLVSGSKKQIHGKVARALSDKISIAVKVDYFKGKFIGDMLKKGLEDRFK